MEAFVLVTSGGGDGEMAVSVCEPLVEFLNFYVDAVMKVPASSFIHYALYFCFLSRHFHNQSIH